MALQRFNNLSYTLLRGLGSLLPSRLFSQSSATNQNIRKWYRELWEPRPRFTPPYDHFTQIGDPVLRAIAAPVPHDLIGSNEIALVVKKMITVMHKYDCVGVAAPQVGVSLRIIALEFREALRDGYPKAVYEARKMATLPLTVVINPALKVTGYEMHKHPEGCMSVRGYSADVERYDAVTLSGYDQQGRELTLPLSGWCARIAQHEMDHLDGKMYLDRMDAGTFICTCWEAVNAKGGRVEIPFYK